MLPDNIRSRFYIKPSGTVASYSTCEIGSCEDLKLLADLTVVYGSRPSLILRECFPEESARPFVSLSVIQPLIQSLRPSLIRRAVVRWSFAQRAKTMA